MIRPVSRSLTRQLTSSRTLLGNPVSRRFVSSNASTLNKSRSWKNTFLRLGTAGAFVWWFNTTDAFDNTPAYIHTVPRPGSGNENLPTIETIAEQKRKRQAEEAAKSQPAKAQIADNEGQVESAENLEAEADQQGAFNPETGEINWDCPCLGGMAHGPCGEEFKTAFSCFVYSTEEPKGMDCVDKFKGMQDCFRQYPEIYGPELNDEDDLPEGELDESNSSSSGEPPNTPNSQESGENTLQSEKSESSAETKLHTSQSPDSAVSNNNRPRNSDDKQTDDPPTGNEPKHHAPSIGEEAVPEKWHSSTGKSEHNSSPAQQSNQKTSD